MTGEEYSRHLWLYYEDMINLQVTHSIYYPRDFRGTRDPGSEPYDGTADIDEFERWLVHLLKFYQTSKLCGRRADFLRVIHAGKYLSGEASNLYESHVYSVDRDAGIRWTFIEVVHHLFRAFIDESALQLAVQLYYRVRYSEARGVYGYIRELRKKANRLTSKPEEFTFRGRFINGLPDYVVDKMIDRYDVTAESSAIDQMTEVIRSVEKVSKYRKRVKERRKAYRPNHSPSPDRCERTKDKRYKGPPCHKFRSRRCRSHQKEKRTERREQDQDHPNRDDNRRERRFEPNRPQDHNTGKGKGANLRVTCFACQQKGPGGAVTIDGLSRPAKREHGSCHKRSGPGVASERAAFSLSLLHEAAPSGYSRPPGHPLRVLAD